MSGLEKIDEAISKLEEKVKQRQMEYVAAVAQLQQELNAARNDYAELKQQMNQVLQRIDDIIAFMDKDKQ
jgi:predicted  nucleic acid-binding Zn-ribbon protein